MFDLHRPLRAGRARFARAASRFAFRSQVLARANSCRIWAGRARHVGRGSGFGARTRQTGQVPGSDPGTHRTRPQPHPGPQGEEYEALKMARRHAGERDAFAENLLEKVGHKNLPFLDDPFR